MSNSSLEKISETSSVEKSSLEGDQDTIERKLFFKNTEEFLFALKSVPNFGENSENLEPLVGDALLELKNDPEALKVFKETSKRFLELQNKVIKEIDYDLYQIERTREGVTGDSKFQLKLRLGVHSVVALLGYFSVATILEKSQEASENSSWPELVLTSFVFATSVFMESRMYWANKRAKKETEKTVKNANIKNKIDSFLEYLSIVGKKEETGYSYDKDLAQKLASLNLGDTTIEGFLKIHNDLVQSESNDLLHSLQITSEYSEYLDDENQIKLFVDKLLKLDPEDRIQYKDYMQGLRANLSENKPIKEASDIEYKIACQQVYPPANYDTYKYLDEYKDRSSDLEKYIFDKNGMDVYIDGVTGYKLKEGEESNPKILEEYVKRLQRIEGKTDRKVLDKFLDTQIATEAETLEGKLLFYIQSENYSKDALDALIAYQIGEEYQTIIHRSRDQAEQFEDPVTREYIQLSELADIYGDNLKETITEITRKISEGKDARLFKNVTVLPEAKLMIGDSVAQDLVSLPEKARNDSVIQKKIEKTFTNTFQGEESIKGKAKEFSLLFSAKDFEGDIGELWRTRLREFIGEQEGGVDTRALQARQNKVFQEIQNEAQKYQEMLEVDNIEDGSGKAKTKKLRHLKTYFSKNKENAHARMVAHICIAEDPKMLENPNYFELVIFDPERKKNLGTVMLLKMEEPNGKKYLLYNPNPSVGLVSEVSANRLYKILTEQVSTFAKDNGFSGILVNPNAGYSTNRSGLFLKALQDSILKENGVEKKIDLQKSHKLGRRYSYQKNLSVIWER